MSELGYRIRELRKMRGLSQVELGGDRYSGSYISHIESGRRQATPEVLGYLATQLGLPPHEFAPDDGGASDAELAGLLSAARRLHSVHEWDAAVRVAEQAVQLASRDDRELRRWEAEILLAEMMRASARYLEAAELAVELTGRPVVAEVPELLADAHNLASRAYRAAGRLGASVDQGQRAVAFGNQISPGLLSTALVVLLSALLVSGRLGEAAQYEGRLREMVPRLNDADAANATWVLGNASFLRGDTAQGLEWHRQANELTDPHVDPHAWARLRQATAYYVVMAGVDVETAQVWYDQSAPIITLLGTSGDLADMRLVQGHLLRHSGQVDQAAELLQLLAEDAASLDDARLAAEVYEGLGQARESQGDLPKARAAYRSAAEKFEAAGAPERAVSAWRRFAGAE